VKKKQSFTLIDVILSVSQTFYVMGSKIEIISSETVYGWQTAIILDSNIHYLNDELISLETAINFWQQLNGRLLSQEEIKSVMQANIFKLSA
jgi:hypothetical protein